MKKRISTWIVVICAICMLMCIFSIIVFLVWDLSNHEKQNKENDTYIDYICKDYHLVCLDMDERVGNSVVDLYSGNFEFRYGTLVGIPDDEFVYAYKKYLLWGEGQNLVLQNPENKVDVLNDWSISKVTIYYYDAEKNPDQMDMATAEDYVIYEIGENTNDSLIKEIKKAHLNEIAIAEECYTSDYDEVYHKVIKNNFEIYMRIYFEESESVAWDAKLEIYKAENDDGDIIVTVDKGSMDADFCQYNGEYIIDVDSEWYQFIIDTYLRSGL